MQSLSKWFGAVAAIVLLAGSAVGAEAIAGGKVKAVNADKKEVVLTDGGGKDFTFKLGDKVVINRGGKEGKTELNAGDPVQILYDKGLVTWTAEYILVQEGDAKDCGLEYGSFKGYDADKKQFSFTDGNGKDVTFATGGAKVRVNKEAGKIEDFKIGDKILAIVDKSGDKTTLKSVMVERK